MVKINSLLLKYVAVILTYSYNVMFTDHKSFEFVTHFRVPNTEIIFLTIVQFF